MNILNSGTLFIISRKYSFGFSKSALTPRYTLEGRLPLCNTSSEAGALPSEVRIENDSDRKFSKSNIFQSFSGNHCCPRFMVPCSLSAENIFRFFEVRTYPSIHHFGLDVSTLKSNLGRQASPLQHELGSGSPAFR